MSFEPQLAIFDIDGTLVDSQANILQAAKQVCELHGLPHFSADSILGVTGLSVNEAVQRLSGGLREDLTKKIIDDYVEIYTAIRRQPAKTDCLYPGAKETLDALKNSGWQFAIATANTRENTMLLLDAHDLCHYFASVQTASDNASKPHPGMVTRAIAELGADLNRTVMIGDTSFDMMMARAAGASAIGVCWGYQAKQDLLAAGASFVAGSFTELRDHLLQTHSL